MIICNINFHFKITLIENIFINFSFHYVCIWYLVQFIKYNFLQFRYITRLILDADIIFAALIAFRDCWYGNSQNLVDTICKMSFLDVEKAQRFQPSSLSCLALHQRWRHRLGRYVSVKIIFGVILHYATGGVQVKSHVVYTVW